MRLQDFLQLLLRQYLQDLCDCGVESMKYFAEIFFHVLKPGASERVPGYFFTEKTNKYSKKYCLYRFIVLKISYTRYMKENMFGKYVR